MFNKKLCILLLILNSIFFTTCKKPSFVNNPTTVPGAPTIGTATKGNAEATVTFTAPASNGGTPIAGYTVTSSLEGKTAPGSGSPITVKGLTNGTTYTFTVTARNVNGSSLPSSPSNPVIPSTVPGPPIIGTATAGTAQATATVTFTAPAINGGAAITGYTVTSSPDGKTVPGSSSPITVPGLTIGTTYTFTVTATNINGPGPASAASNPVVIPPTPTPPGAPTSVSAIKGNKEATVTFTAPASNGGSAITSYTVTSSPDGITRPGSGSPVTVIGLTNGKTYTFTVTATNAIGTGPASAASNQVTPSTIPDPPIIGTATAGSVQATAMVTFTAPASNGGAAITVYTVTSSPDGKTAPGSASPITVPGLTIGTTYTFTVTATNANGPSLPSSPSNPVIITVSDVPVYVSSAIQNAAPGVLEMTYDRILANIVPASSAFTVMVNSMTRTINPVVIIDGTKVRLTLASAVIYGDNVTVGYTRPAINPLQTPSGGYAINISFKYVTNNVLANVTDGDGNVYNTVTIGTQVWLKENLKTTKYSDGTGIPLKPVAADWIAMSSPAYCWYNNDITYKATYGALYNWYAVNSISNGGKNVCPTGWQIPTNTEWTILTDYLGGPDIAGGKMKEVGTVHWIAENVNASDLSGFTGLPGSYRSQSTGDFINFGTYAMFWSSTEYDAINAWGRGLWNGSGLVYIYGYPKGRGFSVRCIRD